MVDPIEGASNETNEAPEGNQPENSQSLEDGLYTSMDAGDKKPESEVSDDVIDNKEDPKGEAEGESKDEAPEGDKKDDSVEDDGLIGVEESEEDSKKDDKTDGDKKPDGDDKPEADDKDDDKKSEAPDDYKLQIDENSLLGVEAVKHTEELAKKHGLSQEAAEEVLKAKEDAVNEYQSFLDETAEQRAQETVDASKKAWLAESKADPDIGGEKYAETVAKGNRFINAAATPAFKAILKKSGLGNHKDFMALCSKGADLAGLMDDNPDLGGSQIEGEKALEDNLYTTMK